MMIVDLIDEVDFKEKMLGIGVPAKDCQTLSASEQTTKDWLASNPNNISVLKSAVDELIATQATILPEVHQVMTRLLQNG